MKRKKSTEISEESKEEIKNIISSEIIEGMFLSVDHFNLICKNQNISLSTIKELLEKLIGPIDNEEEDTKEKRHNRIYWFIRNSLSQKCSENFLRVSMEYLKDEDLRYCLDDQTLSYQFVKDYLSRLNLEKLEQKLAKQNKNGRYRRNGTADNMLELIRNYKELL